MSKLTEQQLHYSWTQTSWNTVTHTSVTSIKMPWHYQRYCHLTRTWNATQLNYRIQLITENTEHHVPATQSITIHSRHSYIQPSNAIC